MWNAVGLNLPMTGGLIKPFPDLCAVFWALEHKAEAIFDLSEWRDLAIELLKRALDRPTETLAFRCYR